MGAEKAYRRAEEEIAKAQAEGWDRLDFNHKDFRALDRIPPKIAGCTALRSLDLRHTEVSDLSPLSALTGLTRLWLNGTGVTDLSPLSALTGLTELWLHRTGVTDLSPLSALTGLRELWLSGTGLADLSPLSALTGLMRLWLDGTGVTDLRPIRGLRKLAEAPVKPGLTFKDCAACRIDPEIARISGINVDKKRAATLFAYLEHWVPPVDEGAVPPQVPGGFRFTITDDGRLGLALPEDGDAAQMRDLHAILRDDVAEVLAQCPTGTQAAGFARVHRMLERYAAALGAGPDAILPPALWNAGNKLRLELASDAQRTGTAMDEQPKLPADLRDGIAALVQVHNAYVSGHPALAALDAVRQDPLERHRAEADRDRMAAFLAALEPQTRVIVAEALAELRALHAQTEGDSPQAQRALLVERDSLDNLINRAVREALIQERRGLVPDLAGDMRAATVGAAAGVVVPGAAHQALPYVATTLPQLVTLLQPHMAALMASVHGADYPVGQALDYVVWRLRQRIKGKPDA